MFCCKVKIVFYIRSLYLINLYLSNIDFLFWKFLWNIIMIYFFWIFLLQFLWQIKQLKLFVKGNVFEKCIGLRQKILDIETPSGKKIVVLSASFIKKMKTSESNIATFWISNDHHRIFFRPFHFSRKFPLKVA